MDLQSNLFEQYLRRDLAERDERAKELGDLLGADSLDKMADGDRLKVAADDLGSIVEKAMGVIVADAKIITALASELNEQKDRQPRLDSNLVSQIQLWKAEAAKWQKEADFLRAKLNRM